MIQELEVVEHARLLRERGARAKAEHVFEDLDDAELDAYWVMEEDERQARARMWLSHNGTWLEQEKGLSWFSVSASVCKGGMLIVVINRETREESSV